MHRTWIDPRADERIPPPRYTAMQRRQMISQRQMQVKCRVAHGYHAWRISTIFIKSLGRKVIDRDLWIVNQLPACILHAHAECHIVMNLRSRSAQPCIKTDITNRITAVAHVDSFEHIDFAWFARAKMMITSEFSGERYLPDNMTFAQQHTALQMYPVPPTEPT
ncbi:hypothetical protein ATN79_25480 [Paraburkholderia caribensis]|nr:hypothetical protein ATN79_25480 [Paraburkholderia caribensis]